MDIFQGWYKDGSDHEGTRDYRYLSALGLVLRIGFSCAFIRVFLWDYKITVTRDWAVLGMLQILLGICLFAVKPYKREWMCHVDGLILMLVGILLFFHGLYHTSKYILGAVVAAMVVCLVCIYSALKCRRKTVNIN